MKISENNSGESLLFLSFYVMAFVTPLIVLPIGSERFELPKLAAVAVFIFLMMLATTVRMIVGKGHFTFTSIGVSVIVFLALAMISFWQSEDRISGLYGHFGRYDGLVTYGLLGALFLVASQLQWRERMLKNLLLAISGGALVTCFIAVLEYLGLNLVGFQSTSGRVIATLGHPIFLSSYLIFAFFCAAILAFSSRSKLLYATSSLIFIVIIISVTRSAILGLIVGTISVLVHQRRKTYRFLLPIGLMLMAVFLIAVTVQSYSTQVGKMSLAQYSGVTHITPAIVYRIESAEASLKIIRERPFFGAGPSNFPWAIQKVQRPRGDNNRQDDAHNFWLQTGASLGLPALAALIAATLLSILKCWHLALRNKLFLALFGGMIGFLCIVFFEPTSISSSMLFWLFMGIIASQPGDGVRLTSTRKPINVAVMSIATIATLIILAILVKAVLADASFDKGKSLAKQNQPKLATDSYLRAIRLAPHVDRYYLKLGDLLIAHARLKNDDEMLMSGIYYLEKAVEFGKLDPHNWIRLSQAYQYAAKTMRRDFVVEALNAAEKSLELAPNSPSAHRALGAVLLEQGYPKRALKHLEIAISIHPTGERWLWLGLAHESLGELRQAIRAYEYASQYPLTKIDALSRLPSVRNRFWSR